MARKTRMAMDDDMQRRRQVARDAFIRRRAELDVTQEEVARKAGVAPRTVQNLEHGVWPQPVTRHKLEQAVGWPPGELHRLSQPPKAWIDPVLLDRASELSDDQREWMIAFLEGLRGEGRGRSASGG